MTRKTCKDFDEFAENLIGLQGQYILRSAPTRDWRLRWVDLNGVTVMTGREGAGRVYSGVGRDGCFNVFLLLGRHRYITVDGAPFGRSQIAWVAPGRRFHTATDEPISWLNITVSADLVLRWAQLYEDEFDHSLLGRSVQTSISDSTAPLIWGVHRLFCIDRQSPELLYAPLAERTAREDVMNALFRALLPLGVRAPAPERRAHHIRLLDKALELMETFDCDALCTESLCAVTGASERTVRNVFRDYVGMSPHRYVMARRLHAIRSAIRHAGPEDTITSICSRFGAWDFGRFAKQYKEYFGELPSQSLQGRKRLAPVRRGRDRQLRLPNRRPRVALGYSPNNARYSEAMRPASE
jgi:AraC family transcriptional regulator, ethanolamine operon transcriptional activator